MTIKELVAKLQELDPEWTVWVSGPRDSLSFEEPPPGRHYGYVFVDDRSSLMFVRRK